MKEGLDRESAVKRALIEIRELRAKVAAHERRVHEPIAIIGVGCRYPGADGPDEFWRLLQSGGDAITEIPGSRWATEAYFDPDPDAAGKMSTRCGGFLRDVDRFDADFFGISRREAVSLDPQQRILLEVAWHALEHAGQAPDKLFGSQTGVFIGIAGFDYWPAQLRTGGLRAIDAYFATGISHSVASGRLSYVLGLQGPSVSLDTACSSSLVAVHLAVQSLRSGECDLALAGGVNLILTPETLITLTKARMMAPDGRCKTFDAAADGFVRSEGCGVVVLKRLSQALACGDNILAVIRGSAVNQDGRSSGLTAPNGPSQQAVIRKALAESGIEPGDVSYVEAHGTGTSLGDPIELQALAAALRSNRPDGQPLLTGSVKTNIGHAETAAGVAGLIKVALSLQHETIPPQVHFHQPSPQVPWAELGIAVPVAPVPWPRTDRPRRAGVSSFGFSGTNAHMIVEEAPVPERVPSDVERPLQVFTLSARTESALRELAAAYHAQVSSSSASLSDLAHTANVGRSHFRVRAAFAAATHADAAEKLASVAAGEPSPGVAIAEADGQPAPVAFLFTGQGSQYAGMGRALYETQPVFRDALDRCSEILRPHLDQSLVSLLYGDDAASGRLDETRYTQPALFAFEYALCCLWQSWGIEAGAVLGHSVGEYVAACVAGVFSLEDALALIAARGRLMQSLPAGGAMAAVFASEQRVRALLLTESRLSVATINGPENTAVSGERAALDRFLQVVEAQGLRHQRLQVSHAFHSVLMDPMLDEFERTARAVTFQTPQVSLISDLDGSVAGGASTLDASYWRRHAREAVRFDAGIASLYKLGYRVFLEIGPTSTLTALAAQCVPPGSCTLLSSLKRKQSDWDVITESVVALYVRGQKIDWDGFDRGYGRRRVALPGYPFQRKRYWCDEAVGAGHEASRWQGIVAAGREREGLVPVDLNPHTYPQKWEVLDRLTSAYIIRTLRECGMFHSQNEAHTAADIVERASILPTYLNLVDRWLTKLAGESLLERRGDAFVSVAPLADPDVDSVLQEAEQILQDVPFVFTFLARCGTLLTAVVTGRESALETLFPGGSPETARAIYHEWAISRYFNGISRAIVGAHVASLPEGRTLRIVEVGAGTGGTTASILPVLPPDRTAYWYTDASDFFFTEAERHFESFPFVQFGVLNIEAPPQDQGYGLHAFDLVIAANVLHATKSLTETLDHTRSLLAPGGTLLLYEVTDPPAWFDVSIGLIEGWQRFDDGLRDNGPLLSADRWRSILQARGFEDVTVFPSDNGPDVLRSSRVMIARAPNVDVDRSVVAPMAVERNARIGNAVADSIPDLVSQMEKAPSGERLDLLRDYVRSCVMRVLRRPASDLIRSRDRLMDLGIDSLMAVELRNLIATALKLERRLPATLVFDYPTVDAITDFLASELPLFQRSATDPGPLEGTDRGEAEATVEAMTDEEVEALLIARLERM
jgi:acyl transferase domain-containing protein/SAM-dependent methyltransferase